MDNKEFRKNAHQLVDWMADYLENIEDESDGAVAGRVSTNSVKVPG